MFSFSLAPGYLPEFIFPTGRVAYDTGGVTKTLIMEDLDNKQAEHQDPTSGAQGRDDTPPTDPSYWYWKRQEEKGHKSESTKDEPKKEEVTPPTDEFVTREEFAQAQKERKALEFVRQNPEFQPYMDKVLKYWNHPSRRELPVDSAFADAIGPKELMRLGAEQAKREAEEAERTRVGGGVHVREDGGSASNKSVFDMSDEEFAKYKAEKLKL